MLFKSHIVGHELWCATSEVVKYQRHFSVHKCAVSVYSIDIRIAGDKYTNLRYKYKETAYLAMSES